MCFRTHGNPTFSSFCLHLKTEYGTLLMRMEFTLIKCTFYTPLDYFILKEDICLKVTFG